MIKELFSLTQHLEGEELRQHLVIESLPFGAILALAGGYLDAYTYIGRGGVFCNAQTGNLVLMGICAAKGDWAGAFAYLPPILAFVCGVIAAELIKGRGTRVFKAEWPYLVLAFEIIVFVAIGCVPGKGVDILVTVAASFAASIQVSSFTKLADSGYATTMCTGNLRSAAQAAYVAISTKSKAALHKSMRYSLIILAFMLGAGLGSLGTIELGNASIWLAAGLLTGAMAFLALADRKKARG